MNEIEKLFDDSDTTDLPPRVAKEVSYEIVRKGSGDRALIIALFTLVECAVTANMIAAALHRKCKTYRKLNDIRNSLTSLVSEGFLDRSEEPGKPMAYRKTEKMKGRYDYQHPDFSPLPDKKGKRNANTDT